MAKAQIKTFKELIHNPQNQQLTELGYNILIEDYKIFLDKDGFAPFSIKQYSELYIDGFQNAIHSSICKNDSSSFEQDIEQEFVYNVLSTNKDSFFICSLILEFWDELITNEINALKAIDPTENTYKKLSDYRSGLRKFKSYILSVKENNDKNDVNSNYSGVKLESEKDFITKLKKKVTKISYDQVTIKSIFKSRLRTQRRNGLPLDDIAKILKGHTINGEKAELSNLLDEVIPEILFYYYKDGKIAQGKVGDLKSLSIDVNKKEVYVEIEGGKFRLATEIFDENNSTKYRVMECESISDIHIDHIDPVSETKKIFVVIPQIEKAVRECGSLEVYLESLSEDKLKEIQDGLYNEVKDTFYKEGKINLQLIEAKENLMKSAYYQQNNI